MIFRARFFLVNTFKYDIYFFILIIDRIALKPEYIERETVSISKIQMFFFCKHSKLKNR